MDIIEPATEPVIDPADTTEPVEVEVDAPTDDSEKAQVKEMLEWVRVPGWLKDAFTKASTERKYLHTDAFAEDDPNRVSCNDLLRSLWAKLALIWPQQPEATCKAPQMMDPPQEFIDAAQAEAMQVQAMQQQFAMVGVAGPAMPTPLGDAIARWKRDQSVRERTARTAGMVLNKMAKFAHLEQIAQRAALDALSVGLVWIKVGWQEDASRDFLGAKRSRNDAQDQMAKLRQLEMDYAAKKFGQDDARWSELLQLRDYAIRNAQQQVAKLISRDERMAQLAALPPGEPVPPHLIPEPPTFQCGTADVVDLENIRLDWQRVTSPESVFLGRRMAERVWMSRDEVARTFELDDEEREKLGTKRPGGESKPAPSSQGNDPPDPSEDDLEQSERSGANGDVAVWELWDYEQHRVYWFTQGIDRFLRTAIPEVTRRDFFPYLPLFFNPVSGRFMPISDTTLGRKLQDDLNQSLTDDREARVAQYPWYAVGANLISEEDIRAIEGRKPNKVVVLEKPAAEVKSQIVKMDGDDYSPEKYQIGVASSRQNLERMLGVPSEALQGQSKAKFATQVQVSSDNMLAQSGRNGSALSELLRQIFDAWNEFAAAAMPKAQVVAWCGDWAEWPELDRSSLVNGMFVEVVSAGNRGQRRQDLEDIGNAVIAINGTADAALKLQQAGWKLDVLPISKRIETALDLRLPNGLIQPLAMPMGMPQPGPGGMMSPGGAPRPGGPQPSRQGLPVQEASTGVGMDASPPGAPVPA